MSKRIDRVDVRARLPLRRDPYWHRISEGRYVGFRHMTKASPGTWLARAYSDAGYAYETLGDFAALPDGERYDAAKKAAETWFEHLDQGGSTEPHSVKAACEAYVAKLRAERSEQAARDTDGFFRRLVYSDPIAKVLLSKLSKTAMSTFRGRVLDHCKGERGSFNRNVTPIRAALNLAHEDGKVATDQAWLKALKPFGKKEGGGGKRRKLTLDRDERKRLLENSSEEARPFFTALALLPMRPGEISSLLVEHLNVRERALEIPTGKTDPRIVPLGDSPAFAHLKECARGKTPKAWLVSRADGSRLTKEWWRDEIKAAAKKAKLPRATVAYTLRHSLITELVQGDESRGDLPTDIFTVAQLAGTSVKMIEEHYGHLQREHARSALEKLALA